MKLKIINLGVTIAGKEILNGISLIVKSGEIHAVMGPNGSGKSTLACALMGHPQYRIQNLDPRAQIKIGKKEIINLSTEDRAGAGLFLTMQIPVAIPGVSVMDLLRTAYQEIYGLERSKKRNSIHNPFLVRSWQGKDVDFEKFIKLVGQEARFLKINVTWLNRSINDEFSGGEKKKLEMLQALILRPKFAIFDEIDTGLDADALKLVAVAIKRLARSGTGVIVITHYQRLLKYIKPHLVHILIKGRIVKTGRVVLAREIEKNGYANLSQ